MRPPRDAKLLAVDGVSAALWHASGHAEDPPQQTGDAAAVTTGAVAMRCFRGTFEAARALLSPPRDRPHLLSRSRVTRRLQRLTDLLARLFDR